MARASAMLLNGTEELRGQVGKARATLSLAREAEAPADSLPAPRLVGIRP
jgi:hypothetical protein